MKTKLNTTQKLVLSAIIMALYIAILFVSQAISFGAVQMRLATALYGLTYIFPFLVVPLSLANAIANSFGGLGLIDVVGGFCASFLATGSIYLIRKAKLSLSCSRFQSPPRTISTVNLGICPCKRVIQTWIQRLTKISLKCAEIFLFLVMICSFVSFFWCEFVAKDK